MKKILLMGVFALLLTGGVALADTSVNYPSTFSLKVGEKAYVSNYQNMQIEFLKVGSGIVDCEGGSVPCPLGNPVSMANPAGVRNVMIRVSTAGGCGPNADPRCLGAPAFESTFTFSEGTSVRALGLRIKVTSITENSATFNVATYVEDDTSKADDVTIPPLPVPVIRVTTGGTGTVSSGPGTIRMWDKLIVCPNGDVEENCSVCSNGDCRADQSYSSTSPRKLGEPVSSTNPPVLKLKSDETLVSAVKVEDDGDDSTDTAYEVKAKRKARLFFLFPVAPEITYSVSVTGSTTVSAKPWWNFLAW